MYNSLVISISVKVWEAILHGYQGSIIKKMADLIKRLIDYLVNGSIFIGSFTSNKSWIEESLFYGLIVKTMDLITVVFKRINKYIKRVGKGSFTYNSINNLFCTDIDVLRSFFVFIFFFGIGLIGNNIIRGYFSGKSYIVAMVLTIGSLIGLRLKENYKEILGSSWFYGFIISIFTIDEGGGNWW